MRQSIAAEFGALLSAFLDSALKPQVEPEYNTTAGDLAVSACATKPRQTV